MAIRVDWPTIRDEIINNQGAIDAPFLFILPHAGRHLLMAIIDQLRWEATYRYKGHGYDFSDWDELQAIVEATHYGLMDGEEVNQIAESITYLADTLAANMPNLNLEGVDMGNVQQVVNMGCCGGGAITNSGSCGAGIDEMPPTDAPTNPPREFPPVTTPPITPTWTEFKCNMAHYLYFVFRSSVMDIADLVAVGEANYGRVLAVFDETIGLLTPPGISDVSELAWEVYYTIVTWLVSRVTGQSASDMAQEMDRHYDEFICAMYSGDGPDAQSQAVRAVIDDLALPWPARYWIKLIEEQIPYDQIFYADGWETYEFPPSYQNRDCSSCNPMTIDDLLPAPDGYFYVTPVMSEVTITPNNNTVNLTYDGETWSHSPLGSISYHEADVEIDKAALLSRVSASSVHGAVVRFISANGDLTNARLHNFPTTNGGDVAYTDGADVLKYDNAEYANVTAFQDFCNEYSNRGSYGNGEPDLTWRSDTYGTSNPGSMTYKVWVICKL